MMVIEIVAEIVAEILVESIRVTRFYIKSD
jgi:hypothetical protein